MARRNGLGDRVAGADGHTHSRRRPWRKSGLPIEMLEQRLLLSGAQLTQSELVAFVKTTWDLADLADDAITQTLDSSPINYPGIPFKDFISGIVNGWDIGNDISAGQYSSAGSKALDYGVSLAGNYALEHVGLTGVAGVAGLAAWPIEAGLNNFYAVVVKSAFTYEAKLYFQARDAGNSEQAILDASQSGGTVLDGDFYTTDQGWLVYQQMNYLTPTSPIAGTLTSTDFFAYEEHQYYIATHADQLTADSNTLKAAFHQAAAPGAPIITSQPQSQSIDGGANATLSVQATGTGTLQYQWNRNGTAILNANDSSYTTGQAGRYSVTVSNSSGSVLSQTATLTVNSGGPVILSEPTSVSLREGYVVTFDVSASGSLPLHYQWQRNNTDIPGATGTSYTTPTFSAADSGDQYTVRVSNSFGSVTTDPATLTLAAPLTFTWTGAVSSTWDDYRNWNRGYVPTSNDIVVISGGYVTASADASFKTLNFSDGAIGGVLNIATMMNWTGGAISGDLAVVNTGTLAIDYNVYLLNSVLTNAGTIIQGQVYNANVYSDGGTIENLAGATYDLRCGVVISMGTGINAFNNAGTVTKSTNVLGDSHFDVPFNNMGDVNASSGMLSFSSTYTQTAGATILNGGNLSSSRGLAISDGTLTGCGTITGSVTSGGTVMPSIGIGPLTITGSYTQTPGGLLGIQLGGAVAGSGYGQLVVQGTATLAGQLQASLVNGFVPAPAEAFNAMTFGPVTGTFGNSLADLGNGLAVRLHYSPTILSLVTEANSAPTDIALSNASVPEAGPGGALVGTISTVDPDTGDDFVYELAPGSGGDDNASFSISGSQLLTAASFNFEAKSSYSIRVRAIDQGGLSFDKVFIINVTDVDEIPPTVTAVYVRGSTWASGYLSFLAANMSGSSSTYGYAIPVGSGAAQLQTLPWRNLNRISIAFSEDVSVSQAQFVIAGSVGSYSISGFTYNSTDHVATWSLSAAIGADKLYIALPGSGATPVTDVAGNALDGEWTNPTSYSQVGATSIFPAGNGVAGGDFAFRFDVLPGDSTGGSLGKVNVADINQTKSRSALPETTSSYRSDFDGNDLVNVADINYAKSRSAISSLPVDPPGPPSFGPVFSPVSLLWRWADSLLGKHSFRLW